MNLSFLPSNTKMFRAAKNVHRFFYFLNNRLYTFVTFEKSYSKQVAALFGALNALAAGVFLLTGPAHALDQNALPTGYQSVSGNVTFNQSQPNVLNVTTQAQNSVASYNTFNIGSNATVNFALPSASSRILNRVNAGGGLSEIYGNMTSNGSVFLVNPSGVFFGNGASVNVGSLVASTLSISDNNFLNGNLLFTRNAGSAQGQISVANGATIHADSSASFMASSFSNAGDISAANGTIQVGVGDRVTLSNGLIGFTVDEGVKDALSHPAISNSGSMSAESVKFASKTLHDAAVASMVNTGHVKAAKVVTGEGGVIEFVADNGTVENSGTLDASGTTGGSVLFEGDIARNKGIISAVGTTGNGGNINVLGDKVSISNGSLTDASGATGGGNIHIGGGFQGNNPNLRNAQQTAVGQTAQIKADAIDSGDGGEVIVWSDQYTRYYGDISAKGGALSGDGGFVEVSGKEFLDYYGHVDTTAANGQTGTLLLDPLDLTIVEAGGTLVALTDADDFSDTPATSSSINVGLINSTGSNVTLRANRDLIFNNTINAINLTGFNLLGEAGRDIQLNNINMTLTGGNLTLNAGRAITMQGNATQGFISANNITLLSGAALGPATFGSGGISFNNMKLTSANTLDVNAATTLSSTASTFTLNNASTGTFRANTGLNVDSASVITQNAGGAGGSITIRNQGTGTLVFDGDISAVNNVGLETTAANSALTVGSSSAISSSNGFISVFTNGLGSDLTLNGDLTSSNSTVSVATNANQADLTIGAASVNQSASTFSVQTSGQDTLLTVNGSVRSTNGGVNVTTQGTNADIAVGATGNARSNTNLQVTTQLINSGITMNGQLTADTGSLTVSTAGIGSDIQMLSTTNNITTANGTLIATNGSAMTINTDITNTSSSLIFSSNGPNADISIGADANISNTNGLISVVSNGTDGDIQIDGDLNTPNNLVTISTNQVDSSITTGATSSIVASSSVGIGTNGSNADITLNGDATSNLNTLAVTTSGGNSNISIGSSSSLTGRNQVIAGANLGAFTINGDLRSTNSFASVNSGGNSAVSTVGADASIIGSTHVVVSTSGFDQDLVMNGDLTSNTSIVNVSTSGSQSTLAVGNTASVSGASTVTVRTSGANASITAMDGDLTSTTANVLVETTGSSSSLTVGSDALITAQTQAAVETSGFNNDIVMNGDLVSNTSSARVRATQGSSSITVGSSSSISGRTSATVLTNGTDADILLMDGDLTSSAGSVYVNTQDSNSSLNIGANALLRGVTDSEITTSGTSSDITVNGDLVTTTGNILIRSMQNTSPITFGSTGSATSAGSLQLRTQATDSAITLNGDIQSASTLDFITSGNNSAITIGSAGSVVSTGSGVNVITSGSSSPLTVNGIVRSVPTSVNLSTSGFNSILSVGSTGFIRGNTGVLLFSGGSSSGISANGKIYSNSGYTRLGSGSNLLALQSSADIRANGGGTVVLTSDNMSFAAGNRMLANLVQFEPATASTSIGVGGGAGTLQLTQNAFSGITANEILIGNNNTNNFITLGQLDLRSVNSNITFNTTASTVESSLADDTAGNFRNLYMARNRNVTFTGGAVSYTDALTSMGTQGAGGNANVLDDLDIEFKGTSKAYVNLNGSGVFDGKSLDETGFTGGAYINIGEIFLPDPVETATTTTFSDDGPITSRTSFQVINPLDIEEAPVEPVVVNQVKITNETKEPVINNQAKPQNTVEPTIENQTMRQDEAKKAS